MTTNLHGRLLQWYRLCILRSLQHLLQPTTLPSLQPMATSPHYLSLVKFKTILPRTPMIENPGEHTKVPKRFSMPYQGSCQAGRPFLTISYLVTLASSCLAMTTTLLLVVGILRILQELSVTMARSLPHHQITTTLLSHPLK